MAFVLEDGSGLATSNAYISVAYFNTHHVDRGVIESGDITTAEVEQAVIKATDYVDKRFGEKFRGWRRSRAQALEWPRTDALDDDEYLLPDIPTQLQKAVAEYALLAYQLGRDLAPVPGVPFSFLDPTTGEVTSQVSGMVTSDRKKIGPIEVSKGFSKDTSKPVVSSGLSIVQSIPEYPQADAWIQALLISSGSRELRRG